MKLVTFDSVKFIVDGDAPIRTAMEANTAFLKAWEGNPPDERQAEYLQWARDAELYQVTDLSIEELDSLIRCSQYLYMGRYENALVFNE